MKRNPKILILGATGFVGRNIVEQLTFRYILLTPSHKNLNLLNQKEVEEYFINHPIDIVIYAVNVGGKRNTNNKGILKSNLQMFFNVVNCEKYFSKMIFIGSGAEYDKRISLKNVSEDYFGKSIPEDDYGLYKYICSRFIEKNKKIISLRVFGLFGKFEDYQVRFISQNILSALQNKTLTINRNLYFDYIYIKDFIYILEYVMKHKMKHTIYNVGGERYSLIYLAKRIQSILKNKKKIKIKQGGLGNEYTADSSRLFKELRNFSYTPLDIALGEMIAYYRNNE